MLRSDRLWYLSLAVVAIIAALIVGDALKDELGIPFDTTYRIVCAGTCLVFIYKIGSDYPGERWPQISLCVAALVNVALFFTPLVNRPASRGEVMLFALPDAVVWLSARAVSYPPRDVHQRAIRQQLILALILAVAFCAILYALTLMGSQTRSLSH
jgi:hypothetical protein